MKSKGLLTLYAFLAISISQGADAGQLRGLIAEKKTAHSDAGTPDNNTGCGNAGSLPQGAQCLRDVAYGNDRLQRFDVYIPPHAHNAPVIFMVHGGAWHTGDKASRNVVEQKTSRWVSRGFIFISTNYRLMPNAGPLQQAEDIAHALAVAQTRAGSWGGDPAKIILMGHSAGAHLVALLAAAPSKALQVNAKPWLGTILLDSAALDVEQIMRRRHPRFYDDTFGKQPSYWQIASPFHMLSKPTFPLLAVCSTLRNGSCSQAHAFTSKAASLGTHAKVLEQTLSHEKINEQLGMQSGYTEVVEAFMGSLDPSVMQLLKDRSTGMH